MCKMVVEFKGSVMFPKCWKQEMMFHSNDELVLLRLVSLEFAR